MFTDSYISKLHLHTIFLSELGTQTIDFQLNLSLWVLEMLLKALVSQILLATSTKSLIWKQFAIHTLKAPSSLADTSMKCPDSQICQPFFTTLYSLWEGQNSSPLFWIELGVEFFWKPGPTIYCFSEQLQVFNICWQKPYLCLQGSHIFLPRYHFWLQ